jgi:DNA-binding CsgD family transcriptional regulator
MGMHPGKYPSVSGLYGSPPLLERESELELVERVLVDVREERGALVLLEGPAGIGKTRLLGAARELAAARGFQVLRARAGELERELSYGVVRQLYEALLAGCDEVERAELLAGAARLAAPLLAFTVPRDALSGDVDASFALLHGLYWLTANIAERAPVLLAVDDLHWCDSPSLRFLGYLVRRLDGLPVLVAASARPAEPGADAEVLAELESDPGAAVLRLAPLSPAAVAQLLRAGLDAEPAPEFERAVHIACGGNPFLLSELVRSIVAERIEPDAGGAARVQTLAPEALSRLVVQRLRRLGPAAEALARAVAVLGDDCELALAAAVAGIELDAAVAGAAELGRTGILRPHGRLGFVHPVLRTAVYADLTDPERGRAHQRAAELLATRGANPERVAVHLVHVPPQARASVVATLREAARRATAEGAAEIARGYLERALAEPPEAALRPELLLELGEAEVSAGAPGALDHLREAYARLDRGSRWVQAARVLASAVHAQGYSREGADVLQRAIERLDPEDAAVRQRLEAELIFFARFDAELCAMARERLARIAASVSDDSFGGRFLLALLSSDLARAGESPEQARALAHRALAGGLPRADEPWQPYMLAVNTLLSLDELDMAERRFTDAVDDARRRGSAFAFAHASTFRAQVRLIRGRLVEAEADARTALNAVLALARTGGYGFTYGYLAWALAERGDVAEATRMVDFASRAEPTAYQAGGGLENRARVRMAAGDAAGALADSLAVGEHYRALEVRNPSYAAWRSRAALVLLGLGERERARQLVDEELALARRWTAPRALGIALRAAGLLEGGEPGLELLHESVQVLSSSLAQLEYARSLTEYGAGLRRANRRRDARAVLGEALELAHRCAARPLTQRAHTELLAAGARPRRLVRTGLDALTASEHRVAELVSAGHTNREAAQALFVTPKTVEMHLSNVYRKLDIQHRSQLPAHLNGLP